MKRFSPSALTPGRRDVYRWRGWRTGQSEPVIHRPLSKNARRKAQRYGKQR